MLKRHVRDCIETLDIGETATAKSKGHNFILFVNDNPGVVILAGLGIVATAIVVKELIFEPNIFVSRSTHRLLDTVKKTEIVQPANGFPLEFGKMMMMVLSMLRLVLIISSFHINHVLRGLNQQRNH
ncbi:hypothetical protein Hanom_Chr08g00736031 [Helianthus anomalus]